MKIWTSWTIFIKGNSILFTRQLKLLWTIKRFRNSLKAKDSLFNKTVAALIVDEKFGLDWSKLFVRLQKLLYIYAGWINKIPANYWIETRWRQLRSSPVKFSLIVRTKRLFCTVMRFFKALLLAISSTISWRFDQKHTVDYQGGFSVISRRFIR